MFELLRQANRHVMPSMVIVAVCMGLLQPTAAASNDEAILLMSLPTSAATKGGDHIKAQVAIDASPKAVWQTITSYNQMTQFMPGYKKCQVLSDTGNNVMLDVAMKVAAMLPTYKHRFKVVESPSQNRLQIQQVSGDFKYLKANYTLTPKNGGKQTLLSYDVEIDPGFNIPGGTSVLKNNTKNSLKAIRTRSEHTP